MRWFWIAALIISGPVSASASIGTVTDFSGSGVIEREKSVISDPNGASIESMDTAITKKGKMRIDFIDDTRVDIIDHSRLVIDDFVYDPATKTGSLSIKASLGAVRYASGQIARNSRQNVRVRTPTATISVRGTDFIMLVDEIGGSMVTLLPSCDFDPLSKETHCVTGEIRVETDTGFVIMNQAFQTTMVNSRWAQPTPPLILDIEESEISGLLIVRRKSPYQEATERLQETRKLTDFLGIDFLNFDELEKDELTDSIRDIWVTELDKGADYYLRELLVDMIDQLNQALYASMMDQLQKENQEFFAERQFGYDEKTGVFLDFEDPNWHYRRQDASVENTIDMYLNNNYGYKINVEQGDEAVYDYLLGVGNNTIDIKQR